eukprot:scaffold2455_cov387-Prasinococcus_capsulatus_cf.AAC.4
MDLCPYIPLMCAAAGFGHPADQPPREDRPVVSADQPLPGNCRCHYIREGQGPPVVLVHGFGAHSYHWRYTIAALREHHTVFAVCMLGYGWSDKAVIDYSGDLWGDQPCEECVALSDSATQVADFISGVVAEMGQPVVVAGNSIGCIASLFSASALGPQKVRGVVFMNAAGKFKSQEQLAEEAQEGLGDEAATNPETSALQKFQTQVQLAFEETAAACIFYFTKFRIEGILKQVYVNPGQVDKELVYTIDRPAQDPQARDAFYKLSGAGKCQASCGSSCTCRKRCVAPSVCRKGTLKTPVLDSCGTGKRTRTDVNEALDDLEVPLLVVHGMRDPWMVPDRARTIVSKRPDSLVDFVPIDDAGHCPMDDSPVAVNEALTKWIARL